MKFFYGTLYKNLEYETNFEVNKVDYAVETVELTKDYGDILAVDHVNMHILAGEIYGFIGKNGAGKTTLIRMIMGLAAPTEGQIALFGVSEEQEVGVLRHQIGTIIEAPTFCGNMTGYENLEMHRKLLGLSKGVVEEALRLVDGEDFSNRPANSLSMGQRQRMGLARAVMGTPKMLILDEPTNGVDPEGIVHFRQTLEFLQKEYQTTILISSHILSELSQIATYYGIVDHGFLLEEFPASQLIQGERAEIFTDKVEEMYRFLSLKFPAMNPQITLFGSVELNILREDMPSLNRILVEEYFSIFEIRWITETIEDRFMKITGHGGEE